MPQRISKKTLYLNADRTKIVAEDSPDARFLLVRAGSAVNESEVARLEKAGVKVNLTTEDAVPFDARSVHDAEHANETPAQAKAKQEAQFTKAVKAPPEDK